MADSGPSTCVMFAGMGCNASLGQQLGHVVSLQWRSCYLSQESRSPGGPINTTQRYGHRVTFTVSYWLGFGFCFCCLPDEISIERLLCDILGYSFVKKEKAVSKQHKILADFHLQRKFRTSELLFPLEI